VIVTQLPRTFARIAMSSNRGRIIADLWTKLYCERVTTAMRVALEARLSSAIVSPMQMPE
jgi:hypothetical protein